MKRILVCIFLSLILSSSAQALIKVHVQPSEILGLWGFVTNGSGSMGSSIVNDLYEKSAEHTSTNDLHLANIHHLISEYFQEGYSFYAAVEGRDEQGWDIMAHFNYQAARSKDLPEFRSRTQGVIPLIKEQILFSELQALDPVYQRLIWKPNLGQLKKVQLRLEKLIRKTEAFNLIDKQSQFYRASWDKTDDFTMMIIPIPALKGGTHATVIGNTGLVQVLKNEKDLNGRFGVILHEIGHVLYASESPEFQREMANWFLDSKVPTAKLTYQVWEEVLSTITGNGWAFERAAGHEDPADWYNNKEFNDLSKALYPVAKNYLDSGKPLDEGFVKTAIDEFQKRFPEAKRRNRRLLRKVLLITDGTFGNHTEIQEALVQGHKWVKQLNISKSVVGSKKVVFLDENITNQALVILIKPENKIKLSSLSSVIPQTEELTKLLVKPGYTTMLDAKGRLLLLVEANTLKELSGVFDQMNPDEATSELPKFYSF